MDMNTTIASVAKEEYELRLRQMSDEDLRAEFADVRRRYSPLRAELAIRKLAMRDRRSTKIEKLIANQRLRETVSKLKQQMEERRA